MYLKNKVLLFYFLLTYNLSIGQTSFEDFKKAQEEETKKMENEKEDWIKKENERIENFKKDFEKKFEEFKKMEWENMETFKSGGQFLKPKPEKIPMADPKKMIIKKQPLFPVEVPKVKVDIDKKILPFEPIKPEFILPKDDFVKRRDPDFLEYVKKIAKESKIKTTINYFGPDINIYHNEIKFEIKKNAPAQITVAVEQIKSYSKELESIRYQLDQYINLMKLNDWGRVELYKKFAKAYFGDNDKVILFTWLNLILSDYDCKLGISENELYLTIASKIKINWTSFFTIDDKKYYLLLFDQKRKEEVEAKNIYTYNSDISEKSKNFNFLFSEFPQIGDDYETKKVDFNIINKDGTLSEKYYFNIISNKNFVEMYNEFPVLEHSAFFMMPMSEKTFENINSQLKPLLEGKNIVEKTNVILNFVQYAFKYQFDYDQFGIKERPLSPEQTAFFINSDCEDHSAIFAYLVKRILNLEVAMIIWDGHAATAVKFDDQTDGYTLPAPYNNYVVCDATYVGAVCGKCMDNYVGVKPIEFFLIPNK